MGLFDLKQDYEKLGYSSDEIHIHLLKLFTTPLVYAILTILSAVIMFNINSKHSILFHVIGGILISVLIYYLIFFLHLLEIVENTNCLVSFISNFNFINHFNYRFNKHQ